MFHLKLLQKEAEKLLEKIPITELLQKEAEKMSNKISNFLFLLHKFFIFDKMFSYI